MDEKRRYRPWTSDDTATLKRMRAAGYSTAAIAEHMDRHASYIVRKGQRHQIPAGITALHMAMLARVNLRRRMAA